MASSVVLDGAARVELDEAIAYLEDRRPGAGIALLEHIERNFELLLSHPLSGRRVRRSPYRAFVVANSAYTIIYSVEEFGIYVLAIAHHSRRPGYWRNRTPR